MLNLQEARQFFTSDELTNEQLMAVVSEIDCLQQTVLDELFGKAVVKR